MVLQLLYSASLFSNSRCPLIATPACLLCALLVPSLAYLARRLALVGVQRHFHDCLCWAIVPHRLDECVVHFLVVSRRLFSCLIFSSLQTYKNVVQYLRMFLIGVSLMISQRGTFRGQCWHKRRI